MYLKELNDKELMTINGGIGTLITIFVIAAKPTATAIVAVACAAAAYVGYQSARDN